MDGATAALPDPAGTAAGDSVGAAAVMGALIALAFLPARVRAALPQSLGSASLEPAPA